MRIYVYVIDQQKQYMNKNEKKKQKKVPHRNGTIAHFIQVR